MAFAREPTDVRRVAIDRGNLRNRRSRLGLSLRVPARWHGLLWSQYYILGRPKMKIRVWAHDNAFTLIFLAAMFFVTWVVTVACNVL